MVFIDHCEQLETVTVRYSGVNCGLGASKSNHYSGDFIIAGFVSTYFTAILPGFLEVFRFNGVFVIAGFHCIKHSLLWAKNRIKSILNCCFFKQ